MFKKYNLRNYNFILVIALVIATTLGILVINSASSDPSDWKKQIIGFVLGLFCMLVVSLIDYNFILKFYWLIYLLNMVLLIIVKFWGKNVNGATRWYEINLGSSSITIQPSEFTKIFLILFLAKLLFVLRDRFNSFRYLALIAGIIMIPIAMVLTQPDLSTTLLICMVLVTMVYCAGLHYKIIGIILLFAVPIVTAALIYIQQPNQKLLYPHQVKRIMAFIDPDNYEDLRYQQDYSTLAIGSGQLYGKGLNNTSSQSIKNAGYISEAETDFIFAVVGEELGFVGSCSVLFLLGFMVFECILTAIRAKDFTGRMIACGMASLIAYQTFINIGVATEILPNTGLPLPFISKGLSSLVALYGGMGVILNISLQRKSNG